MHFYSSTTILTINQFPMQFELWGMLYLGDIKCLWTST